MRARDRASVRSFGGERQSRRRMGGYQRDGRRPGMPMPEVWDYDVPPPHDDKDISNFKACARGEASPFQAKQTLDWILMACRTYEDPFHPDPHVHSKMAGRRSVGVDILRLINGKTSKQDDSEHG